MSELIKVDFWTPVTYYNYPRSFVHSLIELCDWHFYLAGKQATVVSGFAIGKSEGVIFEEGASRWPSTVLKIVAYVTIIIPAIIFVLKCIFRFTHKYHLIEKFSLPSKIKEQSQLEWTRALLKTERELFASERERFRLEKERLEREILELRSRDIPSS